MHHASIKTDAKQNVNFRSCVFKVFRKYIIGTTSFVAFQTFNCGLYFDRSKQTTVYIAFITTRF